MKKLNKKNIEDILPLSSVQKGMLFHSLKDRDNNIYFEQLSMEITGEINVMLFIYALNKVVEHNPMMRAVYRWEGLKKPVQIIMSHKQIDCAIYDLSDEEDTCKEHSVEKLKNKDREKGFDLEDIPFRVMICKLDKKKYTVIISNHHIMYDGWSNGIILNELFQTYNQLCKGLPIINPIKNSYREYIKWLHQLDQNKQKVYWKSYLAGFTKDYVIKNNKSHQIITKKHTTILEKNLATQLDTFIRQRESTLATIIYCAFGLLLQRYQNSEDVIFGTTVSGRNCQVQGIENMVGLFINTLPMRLKTKASDRIQDVMSQMNNTLRIRGEYSHVPLGDIKKYGDFKSNQDVFNTLVVIENYPLDTSLTMGNQDLKLDNYQIHESIHYDLVLSVMPYHDFEISFVYNEAEYDRDFIENMMQHLLTVIKSMIKSPEKCFNEIDILTSEERERLLNTFNDTETTFADDQTIHGLFSDQVKLTPDHIAVVCEDHQITYKELKHKANRLAMFLREKGITSNSIIGVMITPSIDMIIAIVGILQAGGAYLMIDPDYPQSRKQYMVEDSGMRILITHEVLYQKSSMNIPNVNILFMCDEEIDTQPNCFNFKGGFANDLMYITYTSGTTGKPKGVMVEHRGFVNLVNTHKKMFHEDASVRMSQVASSSFDAFSFEVWPALLSGATLYIAPKEVRVDCKKMKEWLEKYKIEISYQTTFIGEQLLKEKWEEDVALKKLRLAGDRLHHVKPCYYPFQLYNLYGPTESTVWSTSKEINIHQDRKLGHPSIGKPVDNHTIYILNKYMKLQPIGISGELYIGGVGVARGYLNNEELTEEKFVDNPYKANDRLYRTGDMAKWLPNGEIYFIGRADQQVKIRGFRIEPGEIEKCLLKHVKIQEVVVVTWEEMEEDTDKYLVAYYVGDEEISYSDMKRHIKKDLPDYMVPSYFMRLQKIPLTINGKINKISLPQPTTQPSTLLYEPPRDQLEEYLVTIWQEVLGNSNIGISDDFFELGGDSIKAIQVSAQLHKYKYQLHVKDIMQHTTIKELKSYISNDNHVVDQKVVQGRVSLTSIQRWFFTDDFHICNHFNQSAMLFRKIRFDERDIDNIFTHLVWHHDALRMRYSMVDGKVQQNNLGIDEALYSLEVVQVEKTEENIKERIQVESRRIQHNIDITNGPLVKLALFKTMEGDYLLIVIHHLVVDGVSWRILLEDISTGLEQAEQSRSITLRKKTNSFKEWAEAITEYAKSAQVFSELSYWKSIIEKKVDRLPKDGEKILEERRYGDCKTIEYILDESSTTKLIKSNYPYSTDVNELLLTALVSAFNQWGGMKNILINLERHGREDINADIDISRTVGWFTAQYPVVLAYKEDTSIANQIKEVKETLRSVQHKGIGYGILNYLNPSVGMDIHCQPEISFNYHGEFRQVDTHFNVLRDMIDYEVHPMRKRSFSIEIYSMITENQLRIHLVYNQGEFKKERIGQFMNCYQEQICHIIQHCSKKKVKEYTPSDLTYKKLTLSHLEQLNEKLRNKGLKLQNIYELTPLQQGILFHYRKDQACSKYIQQTVLTLQGEINKDLLESSFNGVMDRYDVLRTVFLYDEMDIPLQIVTSKRHISITYEDISMMDNDDRKQYIEKETRHQREKPFALDKDILMRVSLIKTEPYKYRLVWSFHHILMDGWCWGIIYHDLMNIYESAMNKRLYKPKSVIPFYKYIEWLGSQDKEKGINYWKDYLTNYNNIAVLPTSMNPMDENKYSLKEHHFLISIGATAGVNEIAVKQHVTVNTILQAVWGIMLCKYNHIQDVVFGTVVSGRSPEVNGIEEMVGLLINTVPVRVTIGDNMSFLELVSKIHSDGMLSKQHEYIPLYDIQTHTLLKQGLINHIMIYDNYPAEHDLYSEELNDRVGFSIQDTEIHVETNYNFNIVVVPGNSFLVKLKYNEYRYNHQRMKDIEAHMKNIIEQVNQDNDFKLSNVDMISKEEKNNLLAQFLDNLD